MVTPQDLALQTQKGRAASHFLIIDCGNYQWLILFDSLQIKFNSMVNYEWELKYYRGCLIAVSSKCIAYALKGTYSIIIPILILGFIHCIEVSVYCYFDACKHF